MKYFYVLLLVCSSLLLACDRNESTQEINSNYSGPKKKILIDPGHGGKNFGAISARGLLEKRFTLSLALELKELLKNNASYEVYLSRSEDVDIKPSARAEYADKIKADIIISLHFNSVPRNKLKFWNFKNLKLLYCDDKSGFMVIFSSQNNLNNENQKLALSVANGLLKQGLNSYSNWYDWIPFEFIRSSFESEDYKRIPEAKGVYAVSNKSLGLLENSKVPAVIIEAGFIVNRTEELMIMSPTWRASFNQGIDKALANYFNNN